MWCNVVATTGTSRCFAAAAAVTAAAAWAVRLEVEATLQMHAGLCDCAHTAAMPITRHVG